MGGGSAQVNPPYQASVADGLTALLGDAVTVTDGVEVRNRPVPGPQHLRHRPRDRRAAARHAWIYAADGTLLEDKHVAGATLLVGFDDNYPAAGRPGRAARPAGGDRPDRARRRRQGRLDGARNGDDSASSRSVPRNRFRRRHAGAAGRGPRSSRSTTTGVVEAELRPRRRRHRRRWTTSCTAGLIARLAPRDQDEVIAEAAAAAADADVAVVVVGLTEEQETEAVDKTTLHLPGGRTIWSAPSPRPPASTVVVVNSATPVIMPWLDRGRRGALGRAARPGGRPRHRRRAARPHRTRRSAGHHLPHRLTALTPAWSVTPVDGDVVYGEGTAIGYRGHYAGAAPAPAFWLGHGLGYSHLGLRRAELVAHRPSRRPRRFRCTVHEHRHQASREVVQVYFRPAEHGPAGAPGRLAGRHRRPGRDRHRAGGHRPADVAPVGRGDRPLEAAVRRGANCWSPVASATSGPPSTWHSRASAGAHRVHSRAGE